MRRRGCPDHTHRLSPAGDVEAEAHHDTPINVGLSSPAEDLVGPTCRTQDGPLAVGHDLMTIVIGETVDVHPRKTLSDK